MLRRRFLIYHVVLVAILLVLALGFCVSFVSREILAMLVAAFVIAGAGSFYFLRKQLFEPLEHLSRALEKLKEDGPSPLTLPQASNEIESYALLVGELSRQLHGSTAEARENLARVNRTMETTLSSFPDPIFVLNFRGSVDFRNPAADQLALKLLFSGIKRLPEKIEELVEQVKTNGQDYLPALFKEAVLFNFDNQEHYFLPRIIQLKDNAGITFGVAVVLEDITRMRLLDEVKSNLIATVSHELKTPLTGLRMSLYITLEQMIGELSPKQKEVLTIARDEADRMLNTIDALLNMARLEEGKFALQFTMAKPLNLLNTAMEETKQLALQASINLKMICDPDLPEVWVDKARVGHIFSNLIGNAIKYSPTGSQITLKAEIPKDTRMIRFSVQDEGPGIAPEHAYHIFDRFYRIPEATKTGAGLGLAIAREIVSSHGGQIGVHSAEGKGSEFFVLLLRADKSSAPA